MSSVCILWRLVFLSLVFLLLASPVYAGWFGPSTYEDCLLEELKGQSTKRGQRLANYVCSEKFPTPEPDFYDLTDQFKKNISIVWVYDSERGAIAATIDRNSTMRKIKKVVATFYAPDDRGSCSGVANSAFHVQEEFKYGFTHRTYREVKVPGLQGLPRICWHVDKITGK